MDFDMHYTPEQEEFRKGVRAWIEANVRPELRPHCDDGRRTREDYDRGRALRRVLGAKGWLAPLYPTEYGGGGLTIAEAVIIAEEFDEYGVHRYLPSDLGLSLAAPAIAVWGTEEQKQRLLPPIFKGETITWQCFTEPDAGTDLASLKLRADPEGDDFILNGQKIFVGADFDVDFLYTLAVTDPSKPRHANIGAFMVPAAAPGITIKALSMLAGQVKQTVFYDNVRVQRSQLIGGETDGWRVAQSTLEVEHGGSGSVQKRDPIVDILFDFCRKAQRAGKPLSQDPDARATLVDIWLTSQVQRLFGLRNYWMRTAKIPWAWEGSQNSLYGKLRMPRVADQILSVIGPYALTSDPEWQVLAGEIEYQQRASILTHPGGTPEAQKIIMARRIGIARTRQTAAAIV